MPLSVNTHESAALYQSMAANLRKAHGTMREVLEAPDRAATLPGEAPDRAATLPPPPQPSTKVTFASSPDKENASPAYQPRKASPPPARAAAATPTTVASFGEEGRRRDARARAGQGAGRREASAGREGAGRREAGEAGGADQTTAAAGRVGRGPRQEEGASIKEEHLEGRAGADRLPQRLEREPGQRRAPRRGRHAGARLRRLALRGRPAALPAQGRRRAGGAPARRQVQVAAVAGEALTTEGRAPNARLRRDGARRVARVQGQEGAGRRAGERLPLGLERGAARGGAARGPRGVREPRARDARGRVGSRRPRPGLLEAAEPLEAAMDSISPLTDEARSLAGGVAAASVESPADAGAVYPESPADPGAVFPASPAEDDGVVDEEEEEEDDVDELEAEKTWPSSDGSKVADEPPAPEAAWARVARRRSCARRASVEQGRSPRAAPAPGAGWAGAWEVLRDALERGASVGAAAESLAAESSVVLSDAQKEDFCDLMAARDFGSCDEHPEDFPSRELAVEFVEDVKAKAKVSDGVAARESGGSTDLSGLFASVDELGPDLQTALAAASAGPQSPTHWISTQVASRRRWPRPRSPRRGV